jgi:hypothetical protein
VKAPNYDRGLAIIAMGVLMMPVSLLLLLELLGPLLPK